MSVQECTQYNFELQTKQFYYILRNNDPTHHNIKKVQLNPKITSITSTLYNPGYAGPKEGYRILRFSYLAVLIKQERSYWKRKRRQYPFDC